MNDVHCNMVIAFINRKGGTGKTTSAAYIAQALYQRGNKVLGLDLDPERSWLKWSSSGALPYEVEAIAKDDDLEGRVSQHNGVVVIDTPPNDGEIIYTVATFADEVIVPISATALDLNRLASTLQTVEKIEKIRRTPLTSVLFTRWQGQHAMARQAAELLGKRGVPLMDARIRQLTRYVGFDTPAYLEEYEAVLDELGVGHAEKN